ncbi:hypothetical protein [Thermoanaerobacterium thermosaccharolyticum]|uniref:hypothetical protein n=1 Tax=Thermoanaerobacterium thermosaccharolyticum TaxID=1517 RepID=UPI0020A3DED0|nr:hypothetical protein [Thermoanaerobacterium thermosaccharolyticum]MCP2239819.1 hypothetical protein [Thermoanaerobacterium thermosaccharolyticum]
MKKLDKVLISIVVSLIVIGVVVGIFTRFSYKDNVSFSRISNNIDDYKIVVGDVDSDRAFYKSFYVENIKSLSDLELESDYILKVRAEDDRKTLNNTLYTKVNVVKIYKGNDLKGKNYVYIYEPCFFDVCNKTFYSQWGYNFMHSNDEYIVFLRKIKAPQGYHYKNNEGISFLFTSVPYGKYKLKDTGEVIAVDEKKIDQGLKYGDVKDLDIITSDSNVANRYESMKNEVLKKYK